MNISTIIIVLVSIILTSIGIRCTLIAPRLKFITRLISVLFFIPISLFSIFGYLASFEHSENNIYWRILYIVIFISSISAITRLVLKKRQAKTKKKDLTMS
jgi:MFS-type transporter involved in bile tolerance (Atg22 family)